MANLATLFGIAIHHGAELSHCWKNNGQDKTQAYKMQTLFPLLTCFEDVVT